VTCHVIQHDRARAIYKYALEHLPKERCEEIYKNYTIHEKKYGDRAGIEDVIVSKRKFKYEEVGRDVIATLFYNCTKYYH